MDGCLDGVVVKYRQWRMTEWFAHVGVVYLCRLKRFQKGKTWSYFSAWSVFANSIIGLLILSQTERAGRYIGVHDR